MAKKVMKTGKIKKHESKGNKWKLANAAADEDVIELLEEGFEPFAVDDGKVWFKKKGN